MKKIFISKQGGIGDVILATPVLAEIKKQYPDCKLTLMIFPNAVDMVQGLPFIDEIIAYDKKRISFCALWRKLLGYDIAIFLDLSYRPAMAAALAGIPIRAGIEHKRGLWLNRKIKWQEYMDHTYEPYVLWDIVKEALKIDTTKTNLEQLYIADSPVNAKLMLQQLMEDAGLTAGEKYIVSSPITAYYLKNWPLDRWQELYCRIYRQYGYKTVLFGSGKLEYDWDSDCVINLWGRIQLNQLRELIKGAALLVNSCSMPIHAASAVDTPCVVLYGFGDYKRWAPKCNCEVVVTPLSCSPCDGYHGTKCTDPKCMRSISVETVFQAVERCLSK